MRYWKLSLLTAFTFITVVCTLLMSSCIDDSCTRLKCINGGTCADGFCQCPSGYDGAQCETKIVNRFIGTFAGSTRCSDFNTVIDTITINFLAEPNVVTVVRANDKGNIYTGRVDGNRITIDPINNNGVITNLNGIMANEFNKLEFYSEYYQVNDPSSKNTCVFYGERP